MFFLYMVREFDERMKQPVKNTIAKVPVVMQMEALECGAACLAMVLAYYDKWVPLEQVREDCDVSRDGAKAGNIARAARTYGLQAQGYKFEPEELKKDAAFPCIVHWNFNHFVVLKGFRDGRVFLNDPANGDLVLTEAEFDNGFTGVCITFSPGEHFEASGSPKSMRHLAGKWLKGAGPSVAFLALTTGAVSVCAIVLAVCSRFFMDSLLTGENPQLFHPFLLVLSLVTLLSVIASWMQALYSFRICGRFAADHNANYFWHVLRLPMRFFSQRMAADIDLRRNAAASVSNLLIFTLAPIVINACMLVFYFVFMLSYSVPLTCIGLISVLANAQFSYYASKKRINITRVMLRDEAKLNAATVSGIGLIETIKASGAENAFFRKWAGYHAGVGKQMVRLARIDSCTGKIPVIVTALVNDLVLVLGVYLVLQGTFTTGMVLAFSSLLTQFFAPAEMLVQAGQQIQEMRSDMERIDDVLEYPADPVFADTEETAPDFTERRKLSGQLSMRGITFGYSGLSPALIEDFHLELQAGKSVAFVGASGCGKSTLSKLISGLYQPWSGEILFDGHPASEIDRDVFTASVAVVNQDIILFDDTVSANIRMWDKSLEDFDVVLAARDAHIHEDIMQREGGYQYRLREGGKEFSGGQRQRIEIARVLAQDPTLIILDEATSALDAQTEYEVVKSIKERGITSVVISHRLSTVRDCDEIIVLDHGRIVQRGTHEELIGNDGVYSRLIANG